MKIALKIPHSLDLTLAAIAKSLIKQTAIINTFIVICDMESDTTTLKLNYFSDIETIFSVGLVKKSLSLTVICPQLEKETKFIAYENGDHANIQIVNADKLTLVNKKDKIVKLATKLPSESFFYADKDTYTKVRPHHGLVALSNLPLYIFDYKLPSPSSLVTTSVTPSTCIPSSFSAPYTVTFPPIPTLGARPRSSTVLHSAHTLVASAPMSSLTQTTATTQPMSPPQPLEA